MIQKKIVVPVIGIVIAGSTLFGANLARAQGTLTTDQSVVQKNSNKVNLNHADAQKVSGENKAEHKQQKKAELEARLNQAVKDGKITGAQRQAILTKFGGTSAMHKDKEQMHSVNSETRQQAMQQKKAELESWAQKNGLSLQTYQELVGHGGKEGGIKGSGWHSGEKTTTPSQ